MKLLLTLFAVILAAAAVNPAAVDTASRANLNVGSISSRDKLLYRGYLQRNPIPNAVQYQDLVYTGSRNTKISAVRAFEVGYTQWASAWIIRGGVGANNVTVRAQSARGYGYYYNVEIWGR